MIPYFIKYKLFSHFPRRIIAYLLFIVTDCSVSILLCNRLCDSGRCTIPLYSRIVFLKQIPETGIKILKNKGSID